MRLSSENKCKAENTYIVGDCLVSYSAVGTASTNAVESDLRCTSSIYFDNVTLSLHNVTLTVQLGQYNNKFNCSETNGYNIPQMKFQVFFKKISLLLYFIEKNPINFIYSVERIMDFNRAEPTCYRTFFLTPFLANKMELFRT